MLGPMVTWAVVQSIFFHHDHHYKCSKFTLNSKIYYHHYHENLIQCFKFKNSLQKEGYFYNTKRKKLYIKKREQNELFTLVIHFTNCIRFPQLGSLKDGGLKDLSISTARFPFYIVDNYFKICKKNYERQYQKKR